MRDIDAATQAAIVSESAIAITMCALDFSTGVVRFNDSDKDIIFNGDTYQAVGSLGSVSELTEASQLASPGVSLSLSGLDTSILAATLNETYHQRPATVLVQYVDADGVPVGDAYTAWSGFMDVMITDIDDDTFTVSLNCESRLIMAGGLRKLRSQEEHQTRYPADTFYQFLSQLESISIEWGKERVTAAPASIQSLLGGAPQQVEP